MQYQPIQVFQISPERGCDRRDSHDSHCAADEDARFWFIEGECDAVGQETPKHPGNYYYMMGYHDAQHEISLGRIKWGWKDNEFIPFDGDNDEF